MYNDSDTTQGWGDDMTLTVNKSHLLKMSEHLLTLSNRQSTNRPIVHGLGNVCVNKKYILSLQLILRTLELAPGNSWSNHCWPMNCAMYSGRGVGGGGGGGVGLRGGGVGVLGGGGLQYT